MRALASSHCHRFALNVGPSQACEEDEVPALISGSITRLGGLACLAAMLAGCNQLGLGHTTSDLPLNAPVTPVQTISTGQLLGSGPVKVALILPLTQVNGASAVGTSLRNAAELALADSGSSELTVLVKDDRSSAEGARQAAQESLSEGAELIMGPLFAANVREVASVARAANRPVIAFSTDTSVASRNVFLLSFLIESYVDRVVEFAAQRGKKSFAALVPQSDYGNVAMAEFQASAARHGVRVQAIERFAAGAAGPPIQRIAALGDQIDALFIPEQADGMVAMAPALTASGLDGRKLQLLGTGVWNDARVLKLAPLQGAWFAAPENAGFNGFAQRYRAKFGSDPARIATLSYDAVSLAAALARAQGQGAFTESVLTNPAGFNGADGVFRFRADGQNERGLSVLQISNGAASIVSPAPKSFGGAAAKS
jgi:branched-chain amino acid transport system substrate-binding protein